MPEKDLMRQQKHNRGCKQVPKEELRAKDDLNTYHLKTSYAMKFK